MSAELFRPKDAEQARLIADDLLRYGIYYLTSDGMRVDPTSLELKSEQNR